MKDVYNVKITISMAVRSAKKDFILLKIQMIIWENVKNVLKVVCNVILKIQMIVNNVQKVFLKINMINAKFVINLAKPVLIILIIAHNVVNYIVNNM